MNEIDQPAECAAWLALGDERPRAALRSLDLRDEPGFDDESFGGCLFLSCTLTPEQAGHLTATGATVIRDGDERPFPAHRSRLYTPEELFAGFDPATGNGYDSTYDARVYRHWVDTGRQYPDAIDESLARRLHDHSITEALHEAITDTKPVAIMGGHRIERSDPMYASIARIARTLARADLMMLSGGGPGAMEATHLGVWAAAHTDAMLGEAIEVLAPRPEGAVAGREYDDADWLERAFTVRRRWPMPDRAGRYESIGIPTWMYGHEPPNAFATQIAKYFANSVREEGLLAVATNGVVFAPGSAGTIQEIFQDAAQNHYASFGPAAPMVLFGVDYWTEQHPVWAVLDSLSAGRAYSDLITITDDGDEVVDHIMRYRRPAPSR